MPVPLWGDGLTSHGLVLPMGNAAYAESTHVIANGTCVVVAIVTICTSPGLSGAVFPPLLFVIVF